MDGRPNRENKAMFSNSSGVVWTISALRDCVVVTYQTETEEVPVSAVQSYTCKYGMS